VQAHTTSSTFTSTSYPTYKETYSTNEKKSRGHGESVGLLYLSAYSRGDTNSMIMSVGRKRINSKKGEKKQTRSMI